MRLKKQPSQRTLKMTQGRRFSLLSIITFDQFQSWVNAKRSRHTNNKELRNDDLTLLMVHLSLWEADVTRQTRNRHQTHRERGSLGTPFPDKRKLSCYISSLVTETWPGIVKKDTTPADSSPTALWLKTGRALSRHRCCLLSLAYRVTNDRSSF